MYYVISRKIIINLMKNFLYASEWLAQEQTETTKEGMKSMNYAKWLER